LLVSKVIKIMEGRGIVVLKEQEAGDLEFKLVMKIGYKSLKLRQDLIGK